MPLRARSCPESTKVMVLHCLHVTRLGDSRLHTKQRRVQSIGHNRKIGSLFPSRCRTTHSLRSSCGIRQIAEQLPRGRSQRVTTSNYERYVRICLFPNLTFTVPFRFRRLSAFLSGHNTRRLRFGDIRLNIRNTGQNPS